SLQRCPEQRQPLQRTHRSLEPLPRISGKAVRTDQPIEILDRGHAEFDSSQGQSSSSAVVCSDRACSSPICARSNAPESPSRICTTLSGSTSTWSIACERSD